MSPLAVAVRERFEDVSGRELLRLRRKTASLSPEDRAQVEALSAQVLQALAASIEAMLEQGLDADVEPIVRRLFALSSADSADAESSAQPGADRIIGRSA